MNITLSLDNQIITRAREIAASMGKSLNQLIREDLERLTQRDLREQDWRELQALSGQGNAGEWTFNRDDLYERT